MAALVPVVTTCMAALMAAMACAKCHPYPRSTTQRNVCFFYAYFAPILYLFCTNSVLILYLFRIYSVLVLFVFCSYSVLIPYLFCTYSVLLLNSEDPGQLVPPHSSPPPPKRIRKRNEKETVVGHLNSEVEAPSLARRSLEWKVTCFECAYMQVEDPLADLRLLEDMDPLWDQEVHAQPLRIVFGATYHLTELQISNPLSFFFFFFFLLF